MSDKVKLIIEIDARTYNDIKVGKIYSSLRDVPLESADAIRNGIPLDAVENKGEWKKTYLDHVAMGERPSILYCSVCHQCIAYPTNFCPNCGADMRAESENV